MSFTLTLPPQLSLSQSLLIYHQNNVAQPTSTQTNDEATLAIPIQHTQSFFGCTLKTFTLTKNDVFHFAIQQLPLLHHLLQPASVTVPSIFPATATKLPITMIDYLLCKVCNWTSSFSSGLLFITFLNSINVHNIHVVQKSRKMNYPN